jgi:hypothetical protein
LTKASTKGAVIITTAAANSKPCTTGANFTRAARSRSPRRVLERVGDLVRRDRDRRDRAAVMVLRRQAHDVRDRVVVVGWRDLDGNVLQPRQVEQMAGELASGPGQVRPLGGVLLHRPAHPPLGPNTRPNRRAAPSARRTGMPGM